MCRVVELGGIFALVGLGVLLPALAGASSISYTEDFATSGSASNEGDSLSNYPGWTYYEYNGNLATTSATAGGGVLQMNAAEGSGAFALLSAQQIAGQSAFDVSVNPLTVSGQVAGGGEAGSYSVGLVVGNIITVFHPGWPGGANRVQSPLAQTIFLNNTDMGFLPEQGVNNFHTITMTLSEDAAHTSYVLQYSVDAFVNQLSILKTAVGDLNRVGFNQGSSGTGYFTNLSVSQIPEPCTMVLLLAGVLGLLAYAWRRLR